MSEQPRDPGTGRYIPASSAQAQADEAFDAQLFAAAGRPRATAAPGSTTPPIPAGVFEPVGGRPERGDWLQRAYGRQVGRLSSVPLPESGDPEGPR